jgi:hypothetical protein
MTWESSKKKEWQLIECKQVRKCCARSSKHGITGVASSAYQGSKSPVGEPLTIDAPLGAYAPPYDGIETADDDDDDEGVPAPPMVGKKRR